MMAKKPCTTCERVREKMRMMLRLRDQRRVKRPAPKIAIQIPETPKEYGK